MASTPPPPGPPRLPAQTASTSRVAPRPSAKRCWRASSTSSGSTSPPCSAGPARGYSTASPSSISSPPRSSIPHWRRTSAIAGWDEAGYDDEIHDPSVRQRGHARDLLVGQRPDGGDG